MKIKLEPRRIWIDVLVLVIAFIYQAFKYAKRTGLQYNSDSVSYFYPSDLWAGEINPFRMWVFPTFLQWLAKSGTQNLTSGVLFFNFVCALGSIVVFFLILKQLLKTWFLPGVITLFFMQWEVVNRCQGFLLPETFCVFLSLLICYVWLKNIRNQDWLTGIVLPLLILFAIFTKPAFLPLLALYLVYLVFSFRFLTIQKKSTYGIVFISAIFCIWIFSAQNNRLFGYKGISMVSLNNNLANTFLSGGYKYSNDKELVDLLELNSKQGFYSAAFLLNNFSVDFYKQNLSRFPFQHKPTDDMLYMNSVPDRPNFPFERIQQFVDEATWNKAHAVFICKRIIAVFTQYLKAVIALSILFVIWLWKKIKYKTNLREYFYVTSMVFVLLSATAVGGIDDWERLLVFVFPLFIIVYAAIIDIVAQNLTKENEVVSVLKEKI